LEGSDKRYFFAAAFNGRHILATVGKEVGKAERGTGKKIEKT